MSQRLQPLKRVLLAFAVVFGIYAMSHALAKSPLLGKPAPDFGSAITSGEQVRLSELVGQVVVLEFWATWCAACKHTTPVLNRIAGEHEGDVRFLGVNVEQLSQAQLAAAHRGFGAAFPTMSDGDGALQRAYGIRVLPTVVVVGREGLVSYVSAGVPSERELQGAISKALE